MRPASEYIVALLLTFCCAANLPAAEPFLVDFSTVANTDIEDDGVADNNKGGWSDEGINDMYIYPAVTFGKVTKMGYTFNIIDPKQNNGKSVIMLKGLARGKDKPESVVADVASVTGKHIYLLMNSVGQAAKGIAKDHVALVCTITYADKSTAKIDIHSQKEIHPWWGRHLAGRSACTFFLGVNTYSVKYKCSIGVWATQLKNPSPTKKITSLTFTSMKQVTPIVWAATISDDDFYDAEAWKKYKGSRSLPPEGYFTRKLVHERGPIVDAGIKEGYFKGLRSVTVIRNDLLEITVDGGFAMAGPGLSNDVVEPYKKPETFTITSKDDPDFEAGIKPGSVARHSKEVYKSTIGTFPANFIYEHYFYLTLTKPLKSGKTYTIDVAQVKKPMQSTMTLTYDEKKTITPVIKINQMVYFPKSSKRYAYLGWWSGDGGAVDYARYKTFAIVDEKTGEEVFTGDIALRKASHGNSGENVYQLDFSAFRTPGDYHLHVPGLGRSDSFSIGGPKIKEMYYHTMRSFFHQRCGQEFKQPWTSFPKPVCHVECWESGYLVESKGRDGKPSYTPKPGERKKAFYGGYHDAADFDTFTYHMPATAQTLFAFEQFPAIFKDGDLNIPESGNTIPDVLDEARWALFFWRDHQAEDGSVPLGRGNDCDAFGQNKTKDGGRPPFGVLIGTPLSAPTYAATAALYARLVKPYNAEDAASFLASAKKAYDYCRKHPEGPCGPGEKKTDIRQVRAFAAILLYQATGEETYHNDFKKDIAGIMEKMKPSGYQGTTFLWPYLTIAKDKADAALQAKLRAIMIEYADSVVRYTEEAVYRMGRGEKGYLGWGTANGGGYYAAGCLYAYQLTKEQKYLDAACLNADFQLGANPLSKTFITSIGARYPRQPQISPFLFTQPGNMGTTIKGSTIYGLSQYDVDWHPRETPKWRRHRDLNGGAEASSEFTVSQCTGPSGLLYMMLYAIDQKE